MVRAEAQLALGNYDDAKQLLDALEGSAVTDHLVGIRRNATLRQVNKLLSQPEHLDYAFGKLLEIERATPGIILTPEYNLVRIDLRLARGEKS